MFRLYDYQLESIFKLRNGSILCGGVGSGKSLTSLGYYYLQNGGDLLYLTGEGSASMIHPKDLYIITTARKRDTKEWEKELAHFQMSEDPEFNIYKNKVVVDSWNNIRKYADVRDAFFIFDEQRVVGYGAWSKSFIKIARGNNEWILLSATPGDTWQDYMSVFIANGFYKNKTEFEREHIVYNPHVKFRQVQRYLNTGRLIRLRNRILVDMDFNRKTKSLHIDVICKYDKYLYKQTMRNRVNPFDAYKPIDNVSALCYILRQIVNSDDERQSKILEIVEEHPKAIIFYNFNYELDILKDMFEFMDYEVAEWNGHKHQEIPYGDKWVYLVQYTSGCEGWNCITTDTIIFYSQNYSYKVMEQAAGRIDRLNTPYNILYYYHLKAKSGIDLAIERALKQKKKFNEGKFMKW